MNPADLEREVDRVLRRLPLPTAPRALTPAVMAAVHALRTRPWYRRSWSAWPVPWRLAFLTAAIAAVIALTWGAPALVEGAGQYLVTTVASPSVAFVTLTPDDLRRWIGVAELVHLLWRTVLGPLATYAAAFAVVMGGVCAACTAIVARLTDGRAAA